MSHLSPFLRNRRNSGRAEICTADGQLEINGTDWTYYETGPIYIDKRVYCRLRRRNRHQSPRNAHRGAYRSAGLIIGLIAGVIVVAAVVAGVLIGKKKKSR